MLVGKDHPALNLPHMLVLDIICSPSPRARNFAQHTTALVDALQEPPLKTSGKKHALLAAPEKRVQTSVARIRPR